MTIELKKVQFAYPEDPDKVVLDIDSWRVAAGEHVFVHGPSGGGKSTLLNILSGMLKASRGEVSVMGTRLEQLSNRQRDKFRANHIGYVFQQFNLIPYLHALDNILLASHFSKAGSRHTCRDKISDTLTRFNIDESDWHKPVTKLSIGQQQRIAIARAMINQPELLIADEPTSSLDQHNRDNFMAELMAMLSESNTTLIFVSHDLSLANHFKRVDALSDINRNGGER